MTEIESIVEPNGIADDFWWESVAFVSIHRRIIGQGGMGSIYLADDVRLEGRLCALKEVYHDLQLPDELHAHLIVISCVAQSFTVESPFNIIGSTLAIDAETRRLVI